MRIARKNLVMLCGLVSLFVLVSFVATVLAQVHSGFINTEVSMERDKENFLHNAAMCVPPDMEQNANNNEVISPSVSYIRLNKTDGVAVAQFAETTECYTYSEVIFQKIRSIFNKLIYSGIVMIC